MSLAPAAFADLLSPEMWARLRGIGSVVRYGDGETVFLRGAAPDAIFVVLSGALAAVDPRTSPPTLLSTRGPGEILGEVSFLDGELASAEVRAKAATVCVRLPAGPLRAALAADPALGAAVHQALGTALAARVRSMTTAAVIGGFGARLEPNTEEPPSYFSLPGLTQATPLGRVPLHGDRISIGRDPNCDVVLDDARVAGVHARLVRAEDGWRVVSCSARAVVVDGSPVASAALTDGAEIAVGRTTLRIYADYLERTLRPHERVLHAEGLTRRIRGQVVLSGVTLTLVAGEVVAVVGPSGSGKSTLLAALSGSQPADEGSVLLDGQPLAERLASTPGLVGVVPQDDVVLPELTVEESLRFAARLRLPNRTPEEREAAVNRVLRSLGLDGIRSHRIGDPELRGLSGGQRKRVNLAPELLSDDSAVLLLDEPTSGLDPRSADDVVRLARQLADAGRIVVLVTHDLSEPVLAQIDHLVVLAPGGHLAWSGSIPRALRHFGVLAPAEIFNCLQDETPEGWSARLKRSAAAARWTLRGRLLPAAPVGPVTRPLPLVATVATLLHRGVLARLRDRPALAVLALQPLLVATIILLVFPRATSGLVFLLTLSSLWFGMSAAVRELIVDRSIWRRERRVGVSALAWVAAKAGVLALLVGLQCAACALAVGLTGLGAAGFSLPGLVAANVLTGWCGAAVGLWVSSRFRRSDAAVGAIVLMMVPQMALSGVLTPLGELGPVARALAALTPLRYAFHLSLVQGPELAYLKLGEWHSRLVSGELFLLGLRPEGEGSLGLSAPWLVAAMLGFTLAPLLAAVRSVGRDRG